VFNVTLGSNPSVDIQTFDNKKQECFSDAVLWSTTKFPKKCIHYMFYQSVTFKQTKHYVAQRYWADVICHVYVWRVMHIKRIITRSKHVCRNTYTATYRQHPANWGPFSSSWHYVPRNEQQIYLMRLSPKRKTYYDVDKWLIMQYWTLLCWR
jgi:hypothetical protein